MSKKVEQLALCKTSWSDYGDYLARKLHGVETGIRVLDRALLGLSGLVVVQGAPKCHKSTLVLQAAIHQATLGNPALIFDRENGRQRSRTRLLCVVNHCSTIDILAGDTEQRREYIKAAYKLPIYHTGMIESYEELRGWILELLAQYPNKRPFVVVDSLQKLPRIGTDERISMQNWMILFDTAKQEFEGQVTIICTSEKSRGEGGKNYEQASLSAAKGAGGVEYTAEQVLDMRKDRATGGVIVEVVANRDGQEGSQTILKKVLADSADEASFCFRLE